jgi:hypothetical protein
MRCYGWQSYGLRMASGVDTILGRVARQYASKDAAVVTARTVSAWLLPLHAWKQARLRETLAADFTDL